MYSRGVHVWEVIVGIVQRDVQFSAEGTEMLLSIASVKASGTFKPDRFASGSGAPWLLPCKPPNCIDTMTKVKNGSRNEQTDRQSNLSRAAVLEVHLNSVRSGLKIRSVEFWW